MNDTQRAMGQWLAVAGAVSQVAFVIAFCRLASPLANLFSSLARSGIGDPSMLMGAGEEIVEYCAIEFTIGLVGLLCLCAALTVCGYRAGWFFRFLKIYGTLLLFIFPVGTVFGIFFLVCRRNQRGGLV